MSEPLIFIFNCAIKEGKIEEYKQFNREFVDFVEANEPRLIALEVYTNENDTETTYVFVHPDADSEDFHMQVAGDKLNEGHELIDFTKVSIEVFGTPSAAVLEQLRQMAGSGVPVSIKTHHIGGFTRSAAEPTVAAS